MSPSQQDRQRAVQTIRASLSIMQSMLAQARGIALQMNNRALQSQADDGRKERQAIMAEYLERGSDLVADADKILKRLDRGDIETWRAVELVRELHRDVQGVVMRSLDMAKTG